MFSPNSAIPKYYHISFHDCLWNLIWQCSKERSKFWLQWSWSFIIKEICLVLRHYDFPKWLFKGSHLVQKKKEKKKRNLISKKKKKKSFFFKIQFSWTTSWPDPLQERYVGSLSKAWSHSPKQPWRTKSKQCDKIVWVHVKLSPFVCIKYV